MWHGYYTLFGQVSGETEEQKEEWGFERYRLPVEVRNADAQGHQ